MCREMLPEPGYARPVSGDTGSVATVSGSTAVPNDSDKMLEEIMVRYAGAWKALADK